MAANQRLEWLFSHLSHQMTQRLAVLLLCVLNPTSLKYYPCAGAGDSGLPACLLPAGPTGSITPAIRVFPSTSELRTADGSRDALSAAVCADELPLLPPRLQLDALLFGPTRRSLHLDSVPRSRVSSSHQQLRPPAGGRHDSADGLEAGDRVLWEALSRMLVASVLAPIRPAGSAVVGQVTGNAADSREVMAFSWLFCETLGQSLTFFSLLAAPFSPILSSVPTRRLVNLGTASSTNCCQLSGLSGWWRTHTYPLRPRLPCRRRLLQLPEWRGRWGLPLPRSPPPSRLPFRRSASRWLVVCDSAWRACGWWEVHRGTGETHYLA